MMRRVLAALAFVSALACPAAAESWPNRTVRLVVPYPPGGNADVIGRILAQALQQKLGQPFIVDNKSGGGGAIGGSAVAHAAPDGYTFLFSANGPILFTPELVKGNPYLWSRDFEPVAVVTFTPLALLVAQAFPAKTFDEFLDRARSGTMIFASGGMGSSNHLLSEYMRQQMNLTWTTVQYRGTAPALNDLIAGQADFVIDQVSSTTPFINAGTVRALAISSDHRWPNLPDVPTMAELGHPKLIASTFTAMMAPAGTPREVVAKMNAALSGVVDDQALRERIEVLGAEVRLMSPEKSTEFLAQESSIWTPIVRELARNQ